MVQVQVLGELRTAGREHVQQGAHSVVHARLGAHAGAEAAVDGAPEEPPVHALQVRLRQEPPATLQVKCKTHIPHPLANRDGPDPYTPNEAWLGGNARIAF